MQPVLIIIRGNSGSGKSSLAATLRSRLGEKTMVVSQDVVRREMLKVKDTPDNPAVDLLFQICSYGKAISYNVILEGILTAEHYAGMLHCLLDIYPQHLIYYFDVSFEETLARHQTKPNAHEFGEKEMSQWWKEKDLLQISEEAILSQDMSLSQAADHIVKDYTAILKR